MEGEDELRLAIAGKLWDGFGGGTAVTPLTTEDLQYLANRRELSGSVNGVLEALAAEGLIRIEPPGPGAAEYVVRAVLDPGGLAAAAGESR